MARMMGPALLGMEVEAIYHTGIVVYGKEHFFGGGAFHVYVCVSKHDKQASLHTSGGGEDGGVSCRFFGQSSDRFGRLVVGGGGACQSMPTRPLLIRPSAYSSMIYQSRKTQCRHRLGAA
jgi:hypothetical protein